MDRSRELPSDPFDLALSQLTGHPNGALTQPTVVQALDFYGNVTTYVVQTVRWAEGDTAFVTQVNAAGSLRYTLPPKVLHTLQRQIGSLTTQVRRRHGKRLAADRLASGTMPTITPEMRRKALIARRAKAARKRR